MRACFQVATEWDVAAARIGALHWAKRLGFPAAEAVLVATATSEIAHNMLLHAGGGRIWLEVVRRLGGCGLQICATDHGPGIADPDRALEDGYSTSGTLGLGLSGARRMMDVFELRSAPGQGTRVLMQKWLPATSGR